MVCRLLAIGKKGAARGSALPFLLIDLLFLPLKRDDRARRIRCASSPTRPPPALQNSAGGLLARLLSRPLPISRGVQLPPCDSFRAVISAPMTRMSSWSCSQNLAQVRGYNDGRVSPIVPLILLGSTSEIPFLRSVRVAERARERSTSNPLPGPLEQLDYCVPAVAGLPLGLSRYAGAASSEVERVLHSLPRATRNRTQNATPARHSIVMNVVTAIRTSCRASHWKT